ncbi:MAG: cyclase [Deltaproteobacteria bacterium]|nr:MAG: cyclase [Deltaproteobacteria bacterium]
MALLLCFCNCLCTGNNVTKKYALFLLKDYAVTNNYQIYGGSKMKSIFFYTILIIAIFFMTTACAIRNKKASQPFQDSWEIIDLTQTLTQKIPIWPGDPEFKVTPWATYEKDQYFINNIYIGEHSGTHWGTPNTFIKDARSAEMFTVKELVMPAVVIDIRNLVKEDSNYRLSIADVKNWEEKNNRKVPSGSMVILFTGWQNKWNNPKDFLGIDNKKILHWPGFGGDTVKFLIENRKIAGLGTDTHGADPGNDEEFGASFAMYEADGIILECLAGLDKLPPYGSIIIVGGLPVEGGSGSPARIIAFVPK